LKAVAKKDLQTMGLTWDEVEASAQDRQTEVNVWPCASRMRDEPSEVTMCKNIVNYQLQNAQFCDF